MALNTTLLHPLRLRMPANMEITWKLSLDMQPSVYGGKQTYRRKSWPPCADKQKIKRKSSASDEFITLGERRDSLRNNRVPLYSNKVRTNARPKAKLFLHWSRSTKLCHPNHIIHKLTGLIVWKKILLASQTLLKKKTSFFIFFLKFSLPKAPSVTYIH